MHTTGCPYAYSLWYFAYCPYAYYRLSLFIQPVILCILSLCIQPRCCMNHSYFAYCPYAYSLWYFACSSTLSLCIQRVDLEHAYSVSTWSMVHLIWCNGAFDLVHSIYNECTKRYIRMGLPLGVSPIDLLLRLVASTCCFDLLLRWPINVLSCYIIHSIYRFE